MEIQGFRWVYDLCHWNLRTLIIWSSRTVYRLESSSWIPFHLLGLSILKTLPRVGSIIKLVLAPVHCWIRKMCVLVQKPSNSQLIGMQGSLTVDLQPSNSGIRLNLEFVVRRNAWIYESHKASVLKVNMHWSSLPAPESVAQTTCGPDMLIQSCLNIHTILPVPDKTEWSLDADNRKHEILKSKVSNINFPLFYMWPQLVECVTVCFLDTSSPVKQPRSNSPIFTLVALTSPSTIHLENLEISHPFTELPCHEWAWRFLRWFADLWKNSKFPIES